MPEILRDAGSLAAVGATAGLLLLLPLYLAQRGDLERLRRWRELEPERGEPVTTSTPAIAAPVRQATSESAAATRITAERPALERVTAERARITEAPLWKRILWRLPEPRHPMLIAAGAFLVGAGIFLGTFQLLERSEIGDGSGTTTTQSQATVAVLNGSDVGGLAGNVADDVRVNGFELGRVSSTPRSFSQTVVMYTAGNQRAARRLARALGVKPVQPIDRASAKQAGTADLVVIAGDDRAR